MASGRRVRSWTVERESGHGGRGLRIRREVEEAAFVGRYMVKSFGRGIAGGWCGSAQLPEKRWSE
jgi:hypothetical protein